MKDLVNVCIPTIDRFDLIRQTVKSVMESKYNNLKITIIVDDNRKQYFDRLYRFYFDGTFFNIGILFNEKRFGWPKSLNRLFKETDDDYYFYASDDLIFQKNTISLAMEDMKAKFPNGDGVIGITQQLGKFCPAAFGLVGRKWINRFPDRKMFYPKYVHFCGDSELWRYSRSINKFYLSKAVVYHNRPFDNCKKLAQTTLYSDRQIWFPRRDSGKFWPKFK